MTEKWELVYEDRTPSGVTVERGEKIPEGMYHKSVQAWIRSSSGRWLITKRSRGIARGGLWEFPGGSVQVGENSYSALARELREEIGLTPENGIVFTYFVIPEKKVMTDVWVLKQDPLLTELSPDPSEVADIRWAKSDEIRAMIEDGSFISMEGQTYWDMIMRVYDAPVCVDF